MKIFNHYIATTPAGLKIINELRPSEINRMIENNELPDGIRMKKDVDGAVIMLYRDDEAYPDDYSVIVLVAEVFDIVNSKFITVRTKTQNNMHVCTLNEIKEYYEYEV